MLSDWALVTEVRPDHQDQLYLVAAEGPGESPVHCPVWLQDNSYQVAAITVPPHLSPPPHLPVQTKIIHFPPWQPTHPPTRGEERVRGVSNESVLVGGCLPSLLPLPLPCTPVQSWSLLSCYLAGLECTQWECSAVNTHRWSPVYL